MRKRVPGGEVEDVGDTDNTGTTGLNFSDGESLGGFEQRRGMVLRSFKRDHSLKWLPCSE